jgi:hypothetical protein
MRIDRSLAALFVCAAALAGSGCAGSKSALGGPGGAYRIPGLAPDPMAFGAQEGIQAFRIPLGGGVEYLVHAELVGEQVRIVTVVQNGRTQALRYDLKRATIIAQDGRKLELAEINEDPTRQPSAADRATQDYQNGLRMVPRGERNVITRTYKIGGPSISLHLDAKAPVKATPRVVAALQLDDELSAEGGVLPVKLRFEKVQ